MSIAELTTQIDTLNIADIATQETAQIQANVTTNDKGVKDLRPYVSDVAIDIVALMPDKLKEYLMLDGRKNMACVSVVAMGKSNCFAIGAPKTIAQFLLASKHTTIECEDGNVIQLAFALAGDAASAGKGSFLWCHLTIGAFDPTPLATLKLATDEFMPKLGLEAVRTKAINDKVAGTWIKKMHVDLEVINDREFNRHGLSQTEFDLPAGMRATVNWGKDMRNYYGLCMGPCSRVLKSTDYGEYGEARTSVNKGNCQCKSKSGGGKSKVEDRRKADAIWERRMKKKTSPGAGASGT
ncbi:MAG: hypothetical protein ACO3JT_09760 [Candidatus Nanopelagicales bacterium]